ncbi:MAG: ABC transporter ATP-binding protein [Candidatus Caldatribacteriota bacterium]|nr:ABC transporter ATP-binding protein [Candidatus Caldatribacteriota bacterium]
MKNISAGYGNIQVLHDVSIEVREGEIVTLVGANGAGKSTLLKVISGLIGSNNGTITFLGKRIDKMAPEEIVKLGMAQVPEGRRVFPDSTVLTNLEMGAYIRKDTKEIKKDIDKYFEIFPILFERRNMPASLLSGGEQQMLVMVRALMSKPKLVLLDEPSMGLAPKLVDEVFKIIKNLNSEGISIFLVEQNVKKSLKIAQRGYVLETGKVSLQGLSQELLESDEIRKVYLGEN